MNYKIEHLNNGEVIPNATVTNKVTVEIVLTDENGKTYGLYVTADGLDVADIVANELKQYEI